MFKKRISYIAVLLSLLVLLTGSVGATKPEKLTLTNAVDMALEKNIDLKIAKITYENAKIDYKKNKANNLMAGSRYTGLQNEYSLIQAKQNYDNQKDQIIIQTVNEYMKILQSNLNIEVNKKQLELEEKILNDINTQYKRGHKSKLEVLKQENKTHNVESNLEKAKNDYIQLLKEFKTRLGIEEEKNIILENVEMVNELKFAEDTAVEKGLTSSETLKLHQKKIELAKVDLNRAQATTTPELDLKKLKNNLKMTELQYKKERLTLTNSIQNQLYQYQQSLKTLQLSKKNLNEALENYQIVNEQKKAGLKTKNDLLSARLNVMQNKKDRLLKLSNYINNALQLNKTIGDDLRGILNDLVTKKK